MALDRLCTQRLGIFGGTFDPIHMGHLAVASEAMHALRLDRVIFVPARVSPLKQGGTCFTAEERLEMVRLAIAANARFSVSSIDLDRKGLSFTVDTLRLIREKGAGAVRVVLYYGPRLAAHFFALAWPSGDSIAGAAGCHQSPRQ